MEVEAVAVSEAGAEDDLSYEDPDVDEDDLVHRLLRGAELVRAQLRVHGHLGVDLIKKLSVTINIVNEPVMLLWPCTYDKVLILNAKCISHVDFKQQ